MLQRRSDVVRMDVGQLDDGDDGAFRLDSTPEEITMLQLVARRRVPEEREERGEDATW